MNDIKSPDADLSPSERRQMEVENELFALPEQRVRAMLEKHALGVNPLEVAEMTRNQVIELLAEKIVNGQVDDETKQNATKQGMAAARMAEMGKQSDRVKNRASARAKVIKAGGGKKSA